MGRILVANFTAEAVTTPSANMTNMTTTTTATTATGVEAQQKSETFNPTLAVVVSAMIISFFVVGFASGYLRRWLWGQEAEEARHRELLRRRRLLNSRARGMGAHSKAQRGLDPEIVAAMPLVRFKDLDGSEKYFECPVCLTVFEGPDSLKLLPHCAHAFHSDCIDQWFRSHTTCPLCRVSMTSPPLVNADPSLSIRVPPDFDITEADATTESESRVALPAGASSARADRELENPPLDVTPHSNAGGFGRPFMPMIRGGIALARAATMASLRRSSSVGTDLIQRGYVVDSEGTQHHHNLIVQVTAVEHGASSTLVTCAGCGRHSLQNLRQNAPV